mgnify:CR=1 FL=1
MSTQDLHPHSDIVEHLKETNTPMQPAFALASPEEKARYITRITKRFHDAWKQTQKGMSLVSTRVDVDGAGE